METALLEPDLFPPLAHAGRPHALTMVDDTILQQGLAQVDSFFSLADFTDFQEPGNKLAARNINMQLRGPPQSWDPRRPALSWPALTHPWK